MTPAVVRMPADTPMTAFNYTLPPPIYLPSSGGYTGSRFTEDVSAFMMFGTFDLSLTDVSCSPFIGAFFRSVSTAWTKMED